MGFKVYSFGSISNNPEKTDMLVNCVFQYGWGIPEWGRHFRVEARFVKNIEIEFLDAQTKTVIVKVSYVRGFADSSMGDVDKVFAELKKKLLEAGRGGRGVGSHLHMSNID